jgi:phage terminase small subunit
VIKSRSGYPQQSPYVAIANRHADTMLRLAGEFGFTPASRSRNFSYAKGNELLLVKPKEKKKPELEPIPLKLRSGRKSL